MIVTDREAPRVRTSAYEELDVFIGEWRAEGRSYGRPDQSPDNPKAKFDVWTSRHSARWYTGGFYLIHDERAMVGHKHFDTLTIVGIDIQTGRYFAHSFENHGFERRYDVGISDRGWTLSAEFERATIEISDDGNMQTITWEWKPGGLWLPLCDRVAVKV